MDEWIITPPEEVEEVKPGNVCIGDDCGTGVTKHLNALLRPIATDESQLLPGDNLGVGIPGHLSEKFKVPLLRKNDMTIEALQAMGPGTAIAMTRKPGDKNYEYGDTHAEVTDINPETGELMVRSKSSGKEWRWKKLDQSYLDSLPASTTAANPLSNTQPNIAMRKGPKQEGGWIVEPPAEEDQWQITSPSSQNVNEKEFLSAYKKKAGELGINQNPDDPRHFYDYRGAYAKYGPSFGAGLDKESGEIHFPSEFKHDNHPNLIVNGVNTKKNQPLAQTQEDLTYADPSDPWAYLTQEQQNEVGAQFNRRYSGIARGGLGTLRGTLDFFNSKVDSETLEGWSQSIGKTIDYLAPAPEDYDFADKLMEGVGSMATFFIPGLGVMKGANLLAKMPALARLAGGSAMALIESMTEAGDSYRDALGSGKSREDAQADASKVFWGNLPVLMATNMFGFFSGGKNFLTRLVKGGVSEAGQEGYQTALGQGVVHGWDKIKLKDVLESMAIGGILGGGVGSVFDAHSKPLPDQRSGRDGAYTAPNLGDYVVNPADMNMGGFEGAAPASTVTVQGPQGPITIPLAPEDLLPPGQGAVRDYQTDQMVTGPHGPVNVGPAEGYSPTFTPGLGYQHTQDYADSQARVASTVTTPDQMAPAPLTFGPDLESVRKSWPGASVEQGKDGNFQVSTPYGLNIAIQPVGSITADGADFSLGRGRELAADEYVAGAYDPEGKTIKLRYGPDYQHYILDHETFHALDMHGLIKPRERQAMTKHIQALTKKGKWESLSADGKDVGGFEDRAEYVALELQKRKIKKNTLGGRVALRVQDFFNGLASATGLPTVGSVVRGVESGKFVKERAPVQLEDGRTAALRDKHREAMRHFATREQTERANRSSDGRGAVRSSVKLGTKHVLANPTEGDILDFGAGQVPFQTQYLREAGHAVTPYEFGRQVVPGVHDQDALSRKYGTVMANNVLNVQGDEAMLNETLDQMSAAVQDGGRLVTNYPESPRYNNLTVDQVERKLKDRFTDVRRVGGTKRAPVWEASGQKYPTGSQPNVFYGVRTWGKHKAELMEEAKAKGIPVDQVKKFVNQADNVYRWHLANPETITEHNPAFKAVKPNSDFYRWSVDFSTFCKKSDKLTATVGMIQQTLDRGLTAEEFLQVRNMLEADGEIVPCHACYVFTRRMRAGETLERFRLALENLDNPNSLPDLIATDKDGKKTDRNAREWFLSMDMRGGKQAGTRASDFLQALQDKSLAERGLSISDIYSREGLNKISEQFPQMAEVLAAKISGATQGKAMEDHVEYARDVMQRITKTDVARFNSMAGLRWQSWSDFQIQHALDCMQAIADMAMLGLKGHAYTKVGDFVRLLGHTGMKINMSLIPKGTGLDSQGNLVFDDVNGMPFDEAMELRDMFPDNVGTVLIGATDEHIMAALSDPRIDFIIPYHKSGMPGKWMGKVGMGGWQDYTLDEGWRDLRGEKNKKGDHPSLSLTKEWGRRIPSYDQHQFDYDKFMALCRENGVQPPFKKKFGKHRHFLKLITDYKFMHNHEPVAPQMPVQMNFDEGMLKQVMDAYVPGSITAAREASAKVVDEFVAGAPQTPLSQWLPELTGTEQGVNDLMEGRTTPATLFAVRRLNQLTGNQLLRTGDQKLISQQLDLPAWVARQHPEFDPIYQISRDREEMRYRLNYDLHEQLKDTMRWWSATKGTDRGKKFAQACKHFDKLGTEGKLRAEPSDQDLQKFGLTDTEIQHYRALRGALDYVWTEDIYNFMNDWLGLAGIAPEVMEDIDAERRRRGTIYGFMPRTREGRYVIHGSREFTLWEPDPKTGSTTGRQTAYMELLDDWLATATAPLGVFGARIEKNLIKRVNELSQQYPSMDFAYELHRNALPDSAFWQVDTTNLQRIIDTAATRAGASEDLRNEVIKATVGLLHSRGFGGHFKERTDIPGYDMSDPVKSTIDFIQGYNGWKTKAIAATRYHKALSAMPVAPKQQLYEYSRQYVQDQLANSDQIDRLVDKSRGVMYAYFLGAVPKHIILQPTQNFLTVAPILSKYTKFSDLKITKAMGEAAKAMVAGEKFEPNLAAGIQQAREKGLIGAPWTDELQATVNNTLGKVGNGLAKAIGFFTSKGEEFNRVSTYVASYRIATQDLGLPHIGAMKFAEDIIRESHFEYGKKNLPQIVRGSGMNKLLRTGYVFKSYNANYTRFLADQFINSSGNKMVAARSLMALAVLGGLRSLPAWDVLEWWWRKVSGGQSLTAEIKKTLGTWGHAIASGAPNLIGLDLSSSLKYDLTSVAADPFSVANSLVSKPFEAAKLLYERDYTRAAEKLAPSGVANPMKAVRGATWGLEDKHGQPIMDGGQRVRYTPMEALGKAAGFGVTREVDYQQRSEAKRGAEIDWHEGRQGVLDAASKAYYRHGKGSPAWEGAMQSVKEHNAAVKKAAIPGAAKKAFLITTQSINERLSLKDSKKNTALKKYFKGGE